MSGEEHTFKRFDQELTHLNSVVLRMGGLVEDQIAKAVTALREADLEAALRNVVARDHVVNFLDVQADEQIVNLLALRSREPGRQGSAHDPLAGWQDGDGSGARVGASATRPNASRA